MTTPVKPTPAEMRAVEEIRAQSKSQLQLDGFLHSHSEIAAIIHREMEAERAELVEALGDIESEVSGRFGRDEDMSDALRVRILKARAVLAKYEQESHER